jgi:cytoskeletal protein CcmA (bactofilin family)
MALLHGKQIRSTTIDLGKLSGTGQVTFTSSATMSFLTGSSLQIETTPTDPFDVVNLAYLEAQLDEFIPTIEVGPGLTVSVTGSTVSIDIDLAQDSGLTTDNGLAVNVDTDGLTVLGSTLSLNDIIIGNRTFEGDITIDGELTTTTLTVTGSSTFEGVATFENDVTVEGELTTTTLTVTGSSTFGDEATFNGGLTATDGFFSNSLQVATAPSTDFDVVNLEFHSASFSYILDQIESGSILGVTAGAGLTGGGTFGNIALAIELTTNGGLTFSSVGDNSTLEVDTDVLAGQGLTSNGFALDIYLNPTDSGLTTTGGLAVEVDPNSIEINNSNQVSLKSLIIGDRTLQGDVTITGDLTVSGTVTYINTEELLVDDNIVTLNANFATSSTPFSGESGIKIERGNTFSGEEYARLTWNESIGLWTAGLSGSQDAIALYAGNGLLKDSQSATFSLDYSIFTDGFTISGTTISVNFGDISDNIAGNGLTVSGGTISVGEGNFITVDVDDISVDVVELGDYMAGDGLTANGGTLSVDFVGIAGIGLTSTGTGLEIAWGGTSSGLTFSIDDTLKVNVDGVTIVINNDGELEVVDITGLKAEPYYQFVTGITATQNGHIATTDQIPSDYSRIQVFVNGVAVLAQGDVAGLSPSVPGSYVEITGASVSWITNDYSIEPSDVIQIIYEYNI